MPWDQIIPLSVVGGAIAAYVLVKAALWHLRRTRWREAAARLGADYGPELLTSCGPIRGRCRGRDFRIEVGFVGASLPARRAFTRVETSCQCTGPELLLPPDFFAFGFDSSRAKGLRRRGHIGAGSASPGDVSCGNELDPAAQTWLTEALRGWNPPLPERLVGCNPVTLRERKVIYTTWGVVTDQERLAGLVALLAGLAEQLEGAPTASSAGDRLK